MKAQSLRKTLWLTSALFAVALVGGGLWYLTKVRPASAAAPDDVWIKKAWDAYLKDKADAKPTTIWPVSFEQLQAHVTRPDLMSKESRIGVWAYVGPVPPAPREMPKDVAAPDQPKGLAAIGAPSMILRQPPPGQSMVKWNFPGAKKAGYFVTGDFIKEKDAKGRFKLKAVERPDPDVARFKLIYDIYDDETKAPVAVDQVAEFTLIKPEDQQPGFKEKPPAAKPVAAAKPGPGGVVVPGAVEVSAGAPPTPDKVRIDVRKSGDNSNEIEFDQSAYDYFMGTNPDSIAAEVKTEEIKEGIRISGISTGGVAAKFGIQQGDIIKSINGTPVHNRAQALEVVKALPKNIERVTVVIQRNARDIVYNVDPRDPATRAAASKARFDGRK